MKNRYGKVQTRSSGREARTGANSRAFRAGRAQSVWVVVVAVVSQLPVRLSDNIRDVMMRP
jgi:hypothetical protein